MGTRLVALCALSVLAPAVALAQNTTSARYEPPPRVDDGWQTARADSFGVDPVRLAALTQSIRDWPELGVHAILIERSGRLIYEEYFEAFDERWGTPLGRRRMTRDSLHDLRSVTKSVVSALIGVAVRDGAIRSLDQPVVEWFPEYPELNTADRRRLTLRHAIGMTAGLEWNEDVPYTDPRNDEIRMTRDSTPLRYALARPFAHDPDAEFTYNGGLT
jgi:CubicO group peptidase (beta-lactamase class C family)